MKCAGGVKIVRHKPCPECGAKSDGPCPVALANEREAFRDMLAALREVEEYLDDRADVDDGIPDHAMRLLVEVRATITKAEGSQ